MRGRLIARVVAKISPTKSNRSTIQYEPCPVDRREQARGAQTVIEEVCVHVYKREEKVAAAHGQKFSPCRL